VEMRIKFRYSIQEEIHILAIDTPGHIDAVLFDSNGPQYRIIYWNDGERYSKWLYRWEIADCKPSVPNPLQPQ